MKFSMKRRLLAVLLAMTMVLSTAFTGVTSTSAASSKKVKSVTVKIGSKTVTKKTYSLKKGKSATLKVTVKPAAAKKSVTYKTNKKTVATVSKKGKVTAKKAGTAKITITVTGKDKKKKSTWVKIKVTKGSTTTAQPVTTAAPATTTQAEATTEAPAPAKKEVKVTKVSAIDTKTGEITLTFDSKVTADDLKGTAITVTDESGNKVSATFKEVSADGNTATYLIADSDLAKITTGNYTISTDSANMDIPAAVGQSTATVQITGSSVKGLVYYEDVLGYHGITNAKVTIDGSTTKSDAKGFYQKSATPAEYPLITVKADGFFDESKTKIKVNTNVASAYNFEMEKYDISKVYICGTVVDSKDNTEKVQGATVELYEDDEVKAIVKTDSEGRYLFRNYRSTVTGFEAAGASSKTFYLDDLITQEHTYKVKVSKELSKANLTDVYKTSDMQEISLGSARNVNVETKLERVNGLGEITLDLKWSDEEGNEAALKSAESQSVQASFVTRDNEVLASKDIDLGEYLATTNNKLTKGYRLAANDFFGTGSANKKPTLPADTYYLVVKDLAADGTQQNATLVIPVKLTEGGEVTVTGIFTKALSRNVLYNAGISDAYKDKSLINQEDTLKYVTDDKGTLGGNIVINTNVYQKVGNDRVLVSTQPGITLKKSENETAYGARKECDYLASGTDYIIETVKSHLTNADVGVSTKTSDPWSVNLSGAVNIVTVKAANISNFRDQYGTNNTASGTDKVTLKSVTVTSGNKNYTVEVNEEYTLAKLVDGVAIDDEAFKGLTPGQYTVSFDIAEYQKSGKVAEQDEKENLIDLQNATVVSQATYERVYPTTVSGRIKYSATADNTAELSGEGIAVLYNKDKTKIVAADTLTKVDSTTASFSLEDGVDGAFQQGEYVLVVRAKGIDTQTKNITITAANTVVGNQNFDDLSVGGNSTIKLNVTTSTGAALDSDAYIAAYDEYYIDPFSDAVDELAMIKLWASAYNGSCRVQRKGDETYESASVSAGKYNVSITSETIEPKEEAVTVQGSQTKDITVQPKRYDNLVRITLRLNNYNDDTFEDGQVDYVVAVSDDGTVSYDGVFERQQQKEDEGTFMVPKNKAYKIYVYSNDTQVGVVEKATQSEENATVTVNCEKIK